MKEGLEVVKGSALVSSMGGMENLDINLLNSDQRKLERFIGLISDPDNLGMAPCSFSEYKSQVVDSLKTMGELCLRIAQHFEEENRDELTTFESMAIFGSVTLGHQIISSLKEYERNKRGFTLSDLASIFGVSENNLRTILMNKAKQRGMSLDMLLYEIASGNMEVIFG